ncbi:MAG TPA: hypothetical protein IAB31_07485 [Candidatus Choladousia intestinavium]|uniref:DUF5667 domain-containing protein n=1 Tax=Candidatus Choladousia intestinavium TaxID=2840727 RepID=A0A9D1AE63_9FIRM|nr:hypothetical protein [Candidatus Choladousia intestinavium]
MKKRFLKLLGLILTFSVFSFSASGEETGNIYSFLTGINGSETAITVDGNEFPAEIYFYWLFNSCDQIQNQISLYGSLDEITEAYLNEEDGSVKWEAALEDGSTVNEYAREAAEDTLRLHGVIENLAAEEEIQLSEEVSAEISDSYEEELESMGGEEGALRDLLVSQESFERISAIGYLFEELAELAAEPESEYYLEPAQYENYTEEEDQDVVEGTDWTDEEGLSEEEIRLREEILQKYMGEILEGKAEQAEIQVSEEVMEVVPGDFYNGFYSAYVEKLLEAE